MLGTLCIACPGLAGAQLSVDGLADMAAPAALRFQRYDHYSPLDAASHSASLIVLEQPLCDYSGALPDTVRGKTVLASFTGPRCLERGYSDLVRGGAVGVVVYRAAVEVTPGLFAARFGGGPPRAVADSTVPVVEIGRADALALQRHVRERAEQPVYATFRPSPNPWLALFRSTEWFVCMRLLVPVGFVLVAGLAVVMSEVSDPELAHLRSTRSAIVWLELPAAALLAVLTAQDVYGDGGLPVGAKLFFLPGLRGTELASSVLGAGGAVLVGTGGGAAQ